MGGSSVAQGWPWAFTRSRPADRVKSNDDTAHSPPAGRRGIPRRYRAARRAGRVGGRVGGARGRGLETISSRYRPAVVAFFPAGLPIEHSVPAGMARDM